MKVSYYSMLNGISHDLGRSVTLMASCVVFVVALIIVNTGYFSIISAVFVDIVLQRERFYLHAADAYTSALVFTVSKAH